ncbi:SDR family oxidoreductase [Actinomadura viridis]|uniref:NAD(P)-dependent dehydrogenase (Short-subunit alcohol dehydrogenase family) n=1 Tax=Actinomadura viridis TaxID=58110 RepID=A0A931DMF3_9ACTN|nr:SDR family oxidoreductase [Actinomadura viridis]MBG6089303.1 NAD(P)-dependent dehydrogenase (short-subunit alcohol dehydrogenase family) [Actinomadura viridis]
MSEQQTERTDTQDTGHAAAPAGDRPLAGRIALVAGATRGGGRGIAVELGAAGATVYVTGRTTRERRSEVNRPETIEETAELVTAAGGEGIAVAVDHLDPAQVERLVARIDADHGRLDVLVNDVWGGDHMTRFRTKMWDLPLEDGLRMLRLGIDTHAITSHRALPLLIRNPGGLVIEMTDGTAETNAAYRWEVGFFYDLAKMAAIRMGLALAHEVEPYGCTALTLSPGWLRSEAMLENFGVTEENWQEGTRVEEHFAISESPAFVGRAAAALAADPDRARWNGRSVSSGELAKVYGFTDTDGSRPDAWRYVTEVQWPGKPADVTGYR